MLGCVRGVRGCVRRCVSENITGHKRHNMLDTHLFEGSRESENSVDEQDRLGALLEPGQGG